MEFFNFKDVQFTLLQNKAGEPWWVAKEMCDYLELGNVGQTVAKLPKDWKMKIVIDELKSGGRGGDNGRRIIINEAGLYMLIGRSRKPEALDFQKWIYSEVLPTIRKTGTYSVKPKIEAPGGSKQQIPRAPRNYKESVQHLLIQIEANEKLTSENIQLVVQNKKLKPQAIALQRIAESTGLVRCTDAAKIMGVKPHTLTRKCVEDKILYKARRKLIPFQKYVDSGWFELKYVKARDDDSHSYRQTFVTPLGVIKLQELYNPIPPGKQRRLFA